MKVGGAAHLTYAPYTVVVVVVGGDFGAVFGPFAFYGFCVIPLYITTTTAAAITNVNRSYYNYRNNKKNDGTTTTGCIFFPLVAYSFCFALLGQPVASWRFL